MDEWREAWAEEQTRAQAGGQVATKPSILTGWQDDVGWGDFEESEADSEINETWSQKPQDRGSQLQIPQSKHALDDSIDSAISFGVVPGDDFNLNLEGKLSKEQSLQVKFLTNALPEPSGVHPGPFEYVRASSAIGEVALEASVIKRKTKSVPKYEQKQVPGFKTEFPNARGPQTSDETGILLAPYGMSLDTQVGRSSNPSISLIEKLFDHPIPEFNECLDDPGNVIELASTRKAWYRITRMETLRKFNSGDADDNYVRVRWPQSQVRKRTLEIVSGWTKEGRANNDRRMFGSNARIPALSSASPRATEADSVHGMSKRNSAFAVSHQSDSTTVNSRIENSPISPQFNWSTSPGVANYPQLTRRDEKSAIERLSDVVGVVQPSAQEIANLQVELPDTIANIPVELAPIVDEDDEDWGEMVESPATAAADMKSGEVAHDANGTEIPPRLTKPGEDCLQDFLHSLPDISYMMK